jgi:hypothetical protein
MESRFSKYKSDGKNMQSHIANVNNFIDYMYDTGLDLIEKEVEDLDKRIKTGNAPAIFTQKKNKLIELGEEIEAIHEVYYFGKDNKES